MVFLLFSIMPVFGSVKLRRGVRLRPNSTYLGGLNSIFTIGRTIEVDSIEFPSQSLKITKK